MESGNVLLSRGMSLPRVVYFIRFAVVLNHHIYGAGRECGWTEKRRKISMVLPETLDEFAKVSEAFHASEVDYLPVLRHGIA